MKFKQLPIALAISSIVVGHTFAQESHQDKQTVVISARPIIEDVKIDPYSSSAALVTEAQLRDQNAVDLASALRRTPGVQIARYNPVGAFGGDQGGAVFIRGMGVSRPGSEIKTYIDGVPFYMGVWNHPLLDLLPVNGMQSVTVFKSPQPQVNGNNFASVNLQTKRANKEGSEANIRVSAGSFSTVVEQADVTARSGDLDFSLAQGYAKSNGHRLNADGELKNAMGSFAYRIDRNWSANASFLAVDNHASDPGDQRTNLPAVAPKYDTKASLFSTGVTHQHDLWKGELRFYRNQGDGNWLQQSGLDGDTLTHFGMQGLRWKEEFSPWQGGFINFALDQDSLEGSVKFNRISPAPSASFAAPTFKATSIFLGLRQELPIDQNWRAIPSFGIRFNQHNQFDSKQTPTLGLSLISEQAQFFIQASRGINYPGLETTVLSSLIAPLGNSWQKLSAEELDHLEFGTKLSLSRATQLDVSLFKDKVKNRYVFGFPPEVPPPPQFLNLGSYDNQGAEAALRTEVNADLSLFAGVTVMNPSIEHLPYSPKRAFTAGLNANVAGLRVSVDVQSQSDVWALNRPRAAGAVNQEKVDGFTVTNARIAYPIPALGKRGEIFLALENVFDRDYAYRPGYPMPGRSAQIGLAASF
ncbi:TonB-dependent receptor plug domain-containing protein [Undibacterium cyanobacteriorum]|uniref:TonB-dependent receptor plug domain-containing protein n=1 Tax=Undibacterium cyanobacteriorum TaxID=3073561 RepID=A0ABY9RLR7_9BURK|nr:TonB-dependent receptor plug domain-containing protein [Undibacterium sp. 20NA77.5]WMW81901.1 TonB-dependent receptor plug domain-containing protein [Undibacterium sp. 20NA77.5]